MSRQTWLFLGIVVVGVVAIGVSSFKLASPAPAVTRVPAQHLPEPVRDASLYRGAPAVAARGVSSAAASRAPAPRPPRPPSAPPPEPDIVAPVAAKTATLHITSDVPGALVFIDRKYVGTAPVTAEEIEPGSRRINVSAPGYDGVVETLDVAAGPRDVMISLKTIRLDESIHVTHKHGMGSCAGWLRATPQGLRYETDNKNDGFTVALPDLETFKVDFLAKNLKVKIKGGRSYDFTDPGGRADPLYLFHQAVEKARLKQAAR